MNYFSKDLIHPTGSIAISWNLATGALIGSNIIPSELI
jgi:hypothetical protein